MLDIQKRLTNSFYALLALPATGMGFALSIQIAVLSWILSTKFNLDIHEVGIVWAAGPLAGIFGQVIIGLISDKVWFWGGRRRPFILIGGTIAATMIVALPHIDKIAVTLGISNIIIVAIMVAISLDLAINISFNPTRSIIADVTPEGSARTKGYTWMQTISGFFGVFAYVLGAVFGNYLLIYTGAVIVFIFSIIPTFFIKESKEFEVVKAEDGKEKIAYKTDWIALIKIYVAHAFTWLGVQTMFVFIFAYIGQKIFGFTDLNSISQTDKDSIGQIIAISFAILNTVGFILPAFVLEPLARKIGRVKTHFLCIATMSLSYWGIVYVGDTVTNLYVLMGIAGIGWAATVSLPFAIMSEKAAKDKMGFFMGIFNLSVVIPQLIVSLVLSYFISNAVNKDIIFIISGVSLTLSALLWLFVKDSPVNQSEKDVLPGSGSH
ncbi:MAG: MFS transporter [Bacteroidales bacterium]|nr:MFS transporter [Bacteroidales bacterium]